MGEPWYPRVKTLTYYDGVPPISIHHVPKLPPEQNRYGPLEPIERRVFEARLLRQLDDVRLYALSL